uniref:tRNA-dihydrouridine(47) synthase [NAD(P)(+)] n=1 Tax=Ditylenchus dipsaci TaxID=166011 RepID=A0A915DAX7_9BILA
MSTETMDIVGEDSKANILVSAIVEKPGVARIKPEFLDHKPVDLPIVDVKEENPTVKEKPGVEIGFKRTRGMDKNRGKKMAVARKEVNENVVRLCKSIISPGSTANLVPGATVCTQKRNIGRKGPKTLVINVCFYDLMGECRFGIACRFASAHTNEEDLSQKDKKEPDSSFQPVLNNRFQHIQMKMRKRQYDFIRADQIVKELTAVDPTKNKSEESKQLTGSMVIRKEPKIDMNSLRGKTYLAPLTTVGNLPFRRLCVGLGAEITCGEMAVATGLLQGNLQEWSLVKRHPCEKIFGVQLAGGYPDTMTRATQMVVDECEVDFVDVNLGCPLDLINDKGAGCVLANRSNRLLDVLKCMNAVAKDVPISIKMRYGMKEGERTAHKVMERVARLGGSQLITLHPRSKEQRYTKSADWNYVSECAKSIDGKCPLWVCGDVFSYEDYYDRLDNYAIDGVMIGRGALIKPWIFTEIAEKHITATERLDIIKKFVNHGLENWGSDHQGVENTRKFLLEWLSFQCRYIPVGLLEVLPQKMNERPPYYHGRSDLETLLSSPASSSWVKISEMFLGPTPEGFLFVPKHNASAY